MTIQPKIIARLILLSIIVGFIIGDLVNYDLKIIWPVAAGAALALAGVIFIFFRDQRIILVSLTALFLIGSVCYAEYRNRQFEPSNDFKNQTEITGIIATRPTLTDKQQVILQVDRYKILVNLPRYPEFHYGDELKITGKLEEPVIFPDFNYRNYLKGRQIYLVINRADQVENLGYNGSIFKKYLYLSADKFEKALNSALSEPASSFAAGLLLGSKRGLSDELVSSMQTTGTSHLVAISGYNITVIASLLAFLFLPLGRRFSFLLILLIIFGFVALTGASASVVRGGIMAVLIFFARTLDRRANQTNVLLLTASAILIFNPLEIIYDSGFQLSFAAFSGLIYLGPIIEGVMKKITKLPELIKPVLGETLAAQILTLPLLLFSMGKFSLIAPAPNVLILPFVPFIMTLAFLTGLIGMISGFLGKAIGIISWSALEYPIKLIEIFAKIPLASYDLKRGNFILALFLYLIISFITVRYYRKHRHVKIY